MVSRDVVQRDLLPLPLKINLQKKVFGDLDSQQFFPPEVYKKRAPSESLGSSYFTKTAGLKSKNMLAATDNTLQKYVVQLTPISRVSIRLQQIISILK